MNLKGGLFPFRLIFIREYSCSFVADILFLEIYVLSCYL